MNTEKQIQLAWTLGLIELVAVVAILVILLAHA
jgi:type II secretory pathway pseudopilin PulG